MSEIDVKHLLDEAKVEIKCDSDVAFLAVLKQAERTLEFVRRRDESESTLALARLIEHYIHTMIGFYGIGVEVLIGDKDCEDSRFLRHRLLEKVKYEWTVIRSLLPIANEIDEYPSFRYVFNKALQDLKLPEDYNVAIIPSVGDNFELVRFEYAPSIKVLGLPIEGLGLPWHWSVIWHELASLLLEVKGDTLVEMIEKAANVPTDTWNNWLGELISNDDGASPLERDMNTVEVMQHNWMEEFIEDAVSVLSLGEGMVVELNKILTTRYTDPTKGDPRHPAPVLRIAVSIAVLHEMPLGDSLSQEIKILETSQHISDYLASTDVKNIARALYKHAKEFVDETFNEKKQDVVNTISESLVNSGMIETDKHIEANILLSAIAKARRQSARPLSADDIRRILEKHLKHHKYLMKPTPKNEYEDFVDEMYEGAKFLADNPNIELEDAVNCYAELIMSDADPLKCKSLSGKYKKCRNANAWYRSPAAPYTYLAGTYYKTWVSACKRRAYKRCP